MCYIIYYVRDPKTGASRMLVQHWTLVNGPVMIPFKAGIVQYLRAVDHETPTREHRFL